MNREQSCISDRIELNLQNDNTTKNKDRRKHLYYKIEVGLVLIRMIRCYDYILWIQMVID